jgi:membrane-bound inhibitor of C-type lysozyme
MVFKRASLACGVLMSAVALAQTTPVPGGPGVEITHKPVSEIPAQYRADAAKPRKPLTVRYTCPESGRLYVVFNNAQQTATIEEGNTTRYLKQVTSADGGRYANSDASYVFWIKGKQATINARETCESD